MNTISKKLFEGEDMTGTLVSEPFPLNDMIHFGLHAVWTGTPIGDLFFEVSGEIGIPATWETFDSVSVAGAGSQFWIDRNIPYIWARLRYVPSSSTGSLSADAVAKGEL